MICPKCNSNLPKDIKYCPRCGELFNKEDVKFYSEIFETDLMEVYYPSKEEKFKIKGISICYALFTYFYAVYKRLYGVAITSIISLLILFILPIRFASFVFASYGFLFYPFLYIILIALFFYLYFIFKFDELLLNRRKKKLNLIIKNNPGKTKDELAILVEKDKEGNKIGLIITILLTILLIIILILT